MTYTSVYKQLVITNHTTKTSYGQCTQQVSIEGNIIPPKNYHLTLRHTDMYICIYRLLQLPSNSPNINH